MVYGRTLELAIFDCRSPGVTGYPSRIQIARLIVKQGWSYIAEWKGAPLSLALTVAEVRPDAR